MNGEDVLKLIAGVIMIVILRGIFNSTGSPFGNRGHSERWKMQHGIECSSSEIKPIALDELDSVINAQIGE